MPDVIVSDLRLPGAMDGLDLIRTIRARAGFPIPALLVTADPAAPKPGENILVLQKPVGAHALREKLDEAFLLSRSAHAPENP
jgi:CheY-like chemotaxis protein